MLRVALPHGRRNRCQNLGEWSSKSSPKSWRMASLVAMRCLFSEVDVLSHYPQVPIVEIVAKILENNGVPCSDAWRRRLFSEVDVMSAVTLRLALPQVPVVDAMRCDVSSQRLTSSPTTLRCRSSKSSPKSWRIMASLVAMPGVAVSSQRSCEFSLIPPVWLHDVTADLSRQIKVGDSKDIQLLMYFT
jgi:hypothetical protein